MPTPAAGWEQEGGRIASALDGASAVVVVGERTDAAARVAIGIARAQLQRRRVTIADLVGEEPAIQALAPASVLDGLADSLLHGVSPERVTYAVDTAANLTVMPSGVAPFDHDEAMRSDRWPHIVQQFRERGTLLLVVAPSDAPSLPRLVERMDGVVTAGDVPAARGARVLASIAAPAAAPAAAEGPLAPLLPAERRPAPRVYSVPADEPDPRRPRLWLLIALAIALLVAIASWVFTAARRGANAAAPARGDTTALATAAPAPQTSSGSLGPAAEPLAAPGAIANAADSARAGAFVVAIASYDREPDAAALLRKVRDQRALPGATYSQVVVGGMTWYRVTVGTFGDSAGAASMLAGLRARRTVAPDGGRVVEAPFSARVEEGSLAPAGADSLVRVLRERSWPAYATRLEDGMMNVYVGAFERMEQASQLVSALRADSVRASVAYRVGRVQ
ncbi:MAG TPA: SPOR domain-containing protein [Gemmatimonadaceae bacterium]|nr:SPOR domain-containing protein [Gemmatimonadaceae bacterium]